jgi:hypothetical protein
LRDRSILLVSRAWADHEQHQNPTKTKKQNSTHELTEQLLTGSLDEREEAREGRLSK